MVALYGTALVEVTSAVMAELARGKRPERSHQAEFSIGSAGMPSMSDGFYNRSGPPTYSSLIEPQKDQPRDG
ncbi:hypothetical protein, partial [Brevundimonas diminuta]